jgi:CrcB protein
MLHAKSILLLIVGGSLGTIVRYLVYLLADRYLNHILPWGTLIVNLTGSLLIGIFWGAMENTNVPPALRLFLFIGILGSFTTFSTFAFDSMNLIHSGAYKTMIVNLLLNNLGGILLCMGGYYLFSVMPK